MHSLSSPRRGLALVVFFVPVLMLAGCGGSKTATISGTVTYKGKPLEGGFINFLSEGSTAMQKGGSIGKDGSYSVSGVPVGPAKVTVQGVKARRLLLPAQFNKEQGKAAEEAKTQSTEVKVPPKYESSETTDLQYDVQSGSQKKDFDLAD